MIEPAPSRTGPIDDGPGRQEAGFTLVELLVVLLIIGILLAIAIPTFLSVTDSANDTGAQSNLYTTLTGARSYYLHNQQSYSGLYANFGSIDTGVSYVTNSTGPSNPHVVSMDVLSSTAIVLTAYGPGTPDCWGIVDLTAAQAAAVDGFNQAGTLYFEKKGVQAHDCQADDYTGSSSSGLLTSTVGFSTVH